MRYKICLLSNTWDQMTRHAVYGRAYIKARLELRYAKSQTNVYSKEVTASIDVSENDNIPISLFFPQLQAELIDHMLADPDFVRGYLDPDTVSAQAEATTQPTKD
jgi:hypothetical protein